MLHLLFRVLLLVLLLVSRTDCVQRDQPVRVAISQLDIIRGCEQTLETEFVYVACSCEGPRGELLVTMPTG